MSPASATLESRLAFKPSDAAVLAGVDLEVVHAAISDKVLPVRYIGRECVVLRQDLIAWMEDASAAPDADADKDALILELQRRINHLEHQILSADPFLPGNVYKKHAECFRSPSVTPKRDKDLYFMRCEGYIKIGVSNDPQRRLAQIRGGSALTPVGMDYRKAELVRVIEGAGGREYPTHWQFAHLRHTGEWFTEAPELTGYIESLDAAA